MSQRVDAVSAAGGALTGTAGGAKKRLLSLDFMRIFAILLVIFNHTDNRGFYRFLTDDPGTFLYWFNLFFSILCKAAVPLFFMISGALLLKKEESIGATYKRGIRIVLALILFSLLYNEFFAWEAGTHLGIVDFLKKTIHLQGTADRNAWHLWYLYAYIAFLLTVPVLRGFVRNLSKREGLVLFVLSVIFGCGLPVFQFFIGYVNPYLVPSWTTAMILIYPVMGYLLTFRLNLSKVTRKQIVVLWLINLLVFALCEFAQYKYLGKHPGSTDELFLTSNRTLNAPLIYLTFLKLFDRKSYGENWDKIITEIGICTYGVYLIHPFFLRYFSPVQKIWEIFEHGGFIRDEFGIVLTVLCVFLITLAITWVLRRIPVVKKLF